ncbi:MAG: hypothetical protein HY769_09090 [Candidatus Stahlbacteria bacterium]|nr:hypothetical protein [Candidatus Stahlbacteria bacterium]
MRQFEEFEATALFCSTCKQAMPVNKRLLLILPDGELWEYLCQQCGNSVGTKKVSSKPAILFLERSPDFIGINSNPDAALSGTGENRDSGTDSY